RFITEEKSNWKELEGMLDRLEGEPGRRMCLEEAKRFQYLYQRTSADLAKIATFASDPDTHRYLESLVARAYGEIHETREARRRLSPLRWFFVTFPGTFRRHINAFLLSLAVTLAGVAFGGAAVSLDPDAREILIPFSNLMENPSDRVAQEERSVKDELKGVKISGASMYMTHNTRVGFFTMALGITWGIGTVIMLFYNGVILGAVALDYVLAGQSTFLIAWLSPHGVIEIPAILLAGQAGLVLAGALIGRGSRTSLRNRLRRLSGDIVTLCIGVAIMLIWAGFVESFISQYHEPVLPYSLKISFALVELSLLALFLARSGIKEAVR
ncbi:MAG TPA: stage II sporulation protein M, partial [Nitrospiria bacterium]|nr:stage II sporulation protein M [Nitrospiria bacterium]